MVGLFVNLYKNGHLSSILLWRKQTSWAYGCTFAKSEANVCSWTCFFTDHTGWYSTFSSHPRQTFICLQPAWNTTWYMFVSSYLASLSVHPPCFCDFSIHPPSCSAFCFGCLPPGSPGLIRPCMTSETELIFWGSRVTLQQKQRRAQG